MVCNDNRITLYKTISYIESFACPGRFSHVRPYSNIWSVAAIGSKYFMGELGEVNSLGSEATFPFLDDRPAELSDALWRCEADGWLEDDIVAI
ncbi:hypothetical protein RRF57_004969 [Xylaria bambusicola]|uniref:Uncharacterized protein n=1 Tax=Xylaria bambusicola TaxID=326684 RepID=A0AAN7UX68_9PEZI